MRHTKLVLQDGTIWTGFGFAKEGRAIGEVAFTTLMGGSAEQLADPRLKGQILAHTFPMLGNYGIPEGLNRATPAGVIVREFCKEPSNYRSTGALEEYLSDCGVVGLWGVDTRQLMRHMRSTGAQTGVLLPAEEDTQTAISSIAAHRIKQPMTRPVFALKGSGKAVAVVDFSCGEGIARQLNDLGLAVTVYPYDAPAAAILKDKPQGVVLSDGQGDPALFSCALPMVRELLSSSIPMLGCGTGYLLMGIAAGGATAPMRHPHRGANQPVREMRTGRLLITTQYHSHELIRLPDGAETRYTNLHEGSIEGISLHGGRAVGVQFDIAPQDGPHNPAFIVKDFVYSMAEVD